MKKSSLTARRLFGSKDHGVCSAVEEWQEPEGDTWVQGTSPPGGISYSIVRGLFSAATSLQLRQPGWLQPKSKSEHLSGPGSPPQTHLLTLSMDSGSGGGMEKQAEGASWTTPVLLCTTHISGLLLSFRVYLSPLVSCTWDKDTKRRKRLGFLK